MCEYCSAETPDRISPCSHDGLILAQSSLIPAFPVLELQVWVTFKLKLPHMAGGTDLVYNLLYAHYKKLGDVRTLRNSLIKHLHRTYLKHCIFFVLMIFFFFFETDRLWIFYVASSDVKLVALLSQPGVGIMGVWYYPFWFFYSGKKKKRYLFPYSWMQASLFQCCFLLIDLSKQTSVETSTTTCVHLSIRTCVCVC